MLYVGSVDGRLTALDAKSGHLRWQVATGAASVEQPTVFEDTIYFGTSDGLFFALDASTGNLRWQYQTGGAVESAPTGHADETSTFGKTGTTSVTMGCGGGPVGGIGCLAN